MEDPTVKFSFALSVATNPRFLRYIGAALGYQGQGRDRKTVLRASSNDPVWDRQGNQGPQDVRRSNGQSG
jgi:hypothetical protein